MIKTRVLQYIYPLHGGPGNILVVDSLDGIEVLRMIIPVNEMLLRLDQDVEGRVHHYFHNLMKADYGLALDLIRKVCTSIDATIFLKTNNYC